MSPICRTTSAIADFTATASLAIHAVQPTIAVFIPRTYAEAMTQPDAAQWQAAIDVELGAIKKHTVWQVVPLLYGKRAIGSKMISDRK